jgi:hypothetical protein
MDTLMLKEYRRRWQAVAAVEEVEQQKASLALRWQQLNSIIRLAAGLRLPADRDVKEVDAVRRRWNMLKDIYVNSNRE